MTSICSYAKASEDSTFNSLSKSSTAVVQGKVIRNIWMSWDLGTREGLIDIVIERVCLNLAKTDSIHLNIRIGDTIKDVKYIEDDYIDTCTLYKSYIFPVLVDSFILSGRTCVMDFDNQVFPAISLLDHYCSTGIDPAMIRINHDSLSQDRKSRVGRKTKDLTFYSNGRKKSKTITKQCKDNNILTKTITWDENGKKISRIRKKGTKYYKGSRGVIWTFRDNGRLCLRRSEYILK